MPQVWIRQQEETMRYLVKHTATVTYMIEIEADNEEEAMNADSYFEAANSPPTDHYWEDSEIVEVLDEE